ncbi:MAG: hypothetical protein GY948_25645 [Alphaproteobacteria bacterium]|nr:hypothetical protein [Alphaproteobacteria bacterium]
MRLFFHKHPLLTFVLVVCIYSAAKGAFSMLFHTDEQQTAHSEIRQTIGAIASKQVALEERDVLAAIQLFRNKSRRQPPSTRKTDSAVTTLGLITSAQAAQTAAQQHPDIFKRAGFASFEKVPGVLASVSLGAFVLALQDSHTSLRNAMRKGERLAADPKTKKALRAQITRQMGGISNQLKVLELMAESAKALPGNLELVKRHRRAIVQAISAARA